MATTKKTETKSAQGAAPAVGQGSASGRKTEKKPAVKVAPKAVVKAPARVSPKVIPRKEAEPVSAVKERYVYAVGRRKTAVAQVRFFPTGKSEGFEVTVNNRPYLEYFNTYEQREAVVAPLKVVGKESAKVSVHIMGGGLSGQADAIKLGIARALIIHDALLRPVLKAQKLLTRDPRAVERKKPGLKKARRAPQWSKR